MNRRIKKLNFIRDKNHIIKNGFNKGIRINSYCKIGLNSDLIPIIDFLKKNCEKEINYLIKRYKIKYEYYFVNSEVIGGKMNDELIEDYNVLLMRSYYKLKP